MDRRELLSFYDETAIRTRFDSPFLPLMLHLILKHCCLEEVGFHTAISISVAILSLSSMQHKCRFRPTSFAGEYFHSLHVGYCHSSR